MGDAAAPDSAAVAVVSVAAAVVVASAESGKIKFDEVELGSVAAAAALSALSAIYNLFRYYHCITITEIPLNSDCILLIHNISEHSASDFYQY